MLGAGLAAGDPQTVPAARDPRPPSARRSSRRAAMLPRRRRLLTSSRSVRSERLAATSTGPRPCSSPFAIRLSSAIPSRTRSASSRAPAGGGSTWTAARRPPQRRDASSSRSASATASRRRPPAAAGDRVLEVGHRRPQLARRAGRRRPGSPASATACRGRRSSCSASRIRSRRRRSAGAEPERAAAASSSRPAAPSRPRRSRPLHEPVADAPAVDDEATALRVELAPQPARVRVERARAAGRAEAPDVAQQLVLGEDPRRLRRQRPQQLELLVRELDLATGDRDLAGRRVDGQRPDPQRPAAAAARDPRAGGAAAPAAPGSGTA